MDYKAVKKFIKHNYRHFNAAVVVDASEAYVSHLKDGGKMMVVLAGAMSTAELGITLAEMIRQNKVHAITCTGANLEEDMFNLVAHKHYKRIPDYRHLSPQEEEKLLKKGMNRVTDTCIPEEEAMEILDKLLVDSWAKAEKQGIRKFPHEFFYDLIKSKILEPDYEIDPRDSWLVAAAKKNLPLFVPGWEDSTIGNSFVSEIFAKKNIKNISTVKSGLEYMHELIKWYIKECERCSLGFFQIGGGIAGDFPICVVPLINQDIMSIIGKKQKEVPLWGYFCQISDSTTSYGSYSGAVPNEKITWGKLGVKTPKFVIESDATIVTPLVFAYVLAD